MTDHAFSIQQTEDGGYVVAGYTDSFGLGGFDIWVLKLSTEGTVIWEKTYGRLYNDYTRSIQQTTDGGYVVAGYTAQSINENFDLLVLKLDSNGNITWNNTYGVSGSENSRDIQQTLDGGYIVTGYVESVGSETTDFWILKLDESGNVTWEKSYGSGTTNIVRSIGETSEGGYIVAGRTYVSETDSFDFFIINLDSNGDVSWQKTYGGDNFDGATSIEPTSDEGYIVVGWTTSFGVEEYDAWILKLDSSGDVSWQKTYGGSGEDYPVSIQQTSDAGYVVGGWTTSFGSGNRDYWVFKLDTNGDISWEKTYGGTLLDEAHFIRQTTDGGYIVAGDTVSFSTGSSDYLALKLDPNGEIPDCNLSNISNATVASTSIVAQDITSTVLPTSATKTTPIIINQDTSSESRDTCACEGDFDCDGDVDGSDISLFKVDFGRSEFSTPCSTEDPCNGDFDCDSDVDGSDANLAIADFGRTTLKNPCPNCDPTMWCTY